jgi:hypothetical protein
MLPDMRRGLRGQRPDDCLRITSKCREEVQTDETDYIRNAARSSTLVRTNHYPCPFLVKHVLLSKVSMGLNAKLVLVGWKGYHDSASNKVSFRIGTTRKADNIGFDLGIYLIAHFYRMRASGDAVTPEDLWDRENVPPILPEFNDQPVFRGKKGAVA